MFFVPGNVLDLKQHRGRDAGADGRGLRRARHCARGD